jgi:preprotein translocase subunit SecA
LARWQSVAHEVLRAANQWNESSESELRQQVLDLRWRLQSRALQAGAQAASASIAPEAFAIATSAIRHVLGIELHPVQIVGGFALICGGLAEMQTGEGKTLSAILPAFVHALARSGCHVITANDYLARRDADWTRPVFEHLGMSVGCVISTLPAAERRREYLCDVTYSTSREIGFDFLRDRLTQAEEISPTHDREPQLIQRELRFALIDEADSILIDDARTPLIISQAAAEQESPAALACWCDEAAKSLRKDMDFEFDTERRSAWLTDGGCRTVLQLAKPSELDPFDSEQIYRQLEWSLVAALGFARDRHYLVGPQGIGILDESTGRIQEGRQWQAGLHQALEAKERLPISPMLQTAASITVQRLFRQYRFLAGMTGTAMPVTAELRRTFDLTTTVIPTHRPDLRKTLPPRIFTTRSAKWTAVVESVPPLISAGRAVLIGTPSVASSEELSVQLRRRGIPHVLLSARFDRNEAEIIAQAGQPGRVTVATNMAGRGTDIALTPEVAAAGGLHVIATEMHSASRIDRQLVGRCARQGDPGSCQFFLSLEDELLHVLPANVLASRREFAVADASGELPANWLSFFRGVQRQLEERHAQERRDLLRVERERVEVCEMLGLEPCLQVYE